MELKEYITGELNRIKGMLTRKLDGLTQHELEWRPASGCNSIGLVFYHTVRFEDGFVQSRIQGKTQVWEAEGWYKKMSLPVDDVGAHYTIEQVNAFPMPALKDLLGYAEAVWARTAAFLKDATPAELERKINMPRFGDTAVAGMFAFIATHSAEHAGEISYLRGLQRGMDK
jgi:hypothetical protein